jgi:hypothetical protein
MLDPDSTLRGAGIKSGDTVEVVVRPLPADNDHQDDDDHDDISIDDFSIDDADASSEPGNTNKDETEPECAPPGDTFLC